MDFSDLNVTIPAAAGPIRLRITADAFHMLWGAGTGPQTAEGLFEQHRAMFEEIAGDKLMAGDTEDGVVVIDAAYLED